MTDILEILTLTDVVEVVTAGEQGIQGPQAEIAAEWSEIANKPTTFAPVIGAGAADAVAGNDPRLTDARPAVGLDQVNNTSDVNKPVSTAQALAIAAAQAAAIAGAPVQSVAGRTGAVTLTKADVGLGNVDNTSDLDKPVSDSQALAINAAKLQAIDQAPVQSVRGRVGAVWLGKEDFELENVDNTSDTNKPVSIFQEDAIATAKLEAIAAVTKVSIGLGNVDNTSDLDKPVSTAQASAIAGVSNESIGLGNVNNTSDANKPVSTAQASAIAAAQAAAVAGAPVQSVAGRTGNVNLTKADVSLANVDNTSDANKPISTAQAAAIAAKAADIQDFWMYS